MVKARASESESIMVDIECTMETESETIIDCDEKIRYRFLDDIIK